MNKSVKVYMLLDLVALTLIGCLLEGLISKFIGLALDAAPTITVSLLVVFMAVVRWNLWGLIPIPFLAYASIIGGHFSDLSYFRAFYALDNWQLYLSTVIGLASIGINVVFFRNHKTQKVIGTLWMCMLLVILNYLLYSALQFMFYRLFTSGSLTSQAMIEYSYLVKQEDGTSVEKLINLSNYGEHGVIYNTFGLAVAIIGTLVFRSQGVLVNAFDKLVSDKKRQEAQDRFLSSFGNENWDSQKEEASNDESKKEDKQDSSEQ